MKIFLLLAILTLGTLDIFATGDSSRTFYLDSLYESVRKDAVTIEAQLEENDRKKKNGDTTGLNYVFASSKSLVVGEDPFTPGRHIYFSRVNKESYGITNSADEETINNILKSLDAPPYHRRLVVYITSIFTYPEYESSLNSSAGIKKMVEKCQEIISSKTYSAPFSNKNFTTILVIKVFGAHTKDGNDRDDIRESYSLNFQVKHRFSLIFDYQTPSQCKKDLEIAVNSQRLHKISSFVENVSMVYKNLTCDPKAKPDEISKYTPSDVKVNCYDDSYELREYIRSKNYGKILGCCQNLKKSTPAPTGTIISAPGNKVSKDPSDKEIEYAHAKYKKILKECLSVSERISAIASLLQAPEVNGLYEEVILDLIRNIKDSDIPDFLKELKKNYLINNLISSIDDELMGLGDPNYTGLITELKTLIEKSPEFSVKLNQLYQPSVLETRIINWGNQFGSYSFANKGSLETGAIRKRSVTLGENGTVTVSREVLTEITLNESYIIGQDYTGNFNFYTYNWSPLPDVHLDPFEPVIFINHSNLTILDQANNVQKGEMTIVPAIFLEYARRKNLNDNISTGSFVVLDVATLLSGVGTLPNIAGKLAYLRRAFVIMEMANATSNLALNLTDVEREYPELAPVVAVSDALLIATSIFEIGRKVSKARSIRGALQSGEVLKSTVYEQKCKDFVASVNTNEEAIKKVLSSKDITASNKKALNELLAMRDDMVRKFGEEWRDLGKGAGKQYVNDIPFINGWTSEKIMQLPKGQRPNPDIYLPEEYITKHLSKFEKGVSFFCPKDIIDNCISLGIPLGRADGVYVVPISKMEEIMNKTRGNVALIEKELAIPSGSWQVKQMCRVDITNVQNLKLRMPSGNETGANSFFTPGGFTANGQPEAVINPIQREFYNFSILK